MTTELVTTPLSQRSRAHLRATMLGVVTVVALVIAALLLGPALGLPGIGSQGPGRLVGAPDPAPGTSASVVVPGGDGTGVAFGSAEVHLRESADPLDGLVVAEAPEEGTTFATLEVPRWGEDYAEPISEGMSDYVLDTLGMGRFPDAVMPGGVGNFAVFGHRTSHSRPLWSIEELQIGDELIVTTEDGTYTYVMTDFEIVTPYEWRVVSENPHDPDEPAEHQLLTLVACHPLFSSAERYVVYAELASFSAA